MSLKERKILVTGASRGMGRAVSENLLRQGVEVIGIARDFSTWTERPAAFQPITLDLSRLEELPEQAKAIAKRHPELDGVLFNAGHGRFGSLEEFSPDQIRQLIDLNLTSQILLARELLPGMKKRGRGNLIFMGSEAALSGHRKGAVYCATKFALRGLAQALREECSNSGIHVSIINPGMVKTDFFSELDFAPGEAEENYLLAEDIAGAVDMILSARPGTCVDEINLSPLKKVVQFRKGKDR